MSESFIIYIYASSYSRPVARVGGAHVPPLFAERGAHYLRHKRGEGKNQKNETYSYL